MFRHCAGPRQPYVLINPYRSTCSRTLTLTVPRAAVHLHPHTDVFGVRTDGNYPDVPPDDRRVKVAHLSRVSVCVPLNYLKVK